MPSVRVAEHSDLPPDVVLAAARDFSERRANLWPDVHVEHLEIHQMGETWAEVTEGNPWPIGVVWERLRYDWSDPRSLRGTVVDSNIFTPGSTWELWATPENGGSHVEIRANRHLRRRGLLLYPFFPTGLAASTVRDHLKHFLGAISSNVASKDRLRSLFADVDVSMRQQLLDERRAEAQREAADYDGR